MKKVLSVIAIHESKEKLQEIDLTEWVFSGNKFDVFFCTFKAFFFVYRKLKEVKSHSETFLGLRKEIKLTDEAINTTETLLRDSIYEFRAISQKYYISQEDIDIDRLIYKLNFSRYLALLLLSTMQPKSLEEAEELLKQSRKLSSRRDKDYYERKLLEKSANKTQTSQHSQSVTISQLSQSVTKVNKSKWFLKMTVFYLKFSSQWKFVQTITTLTQKLIYRKINKFFFLFDDRVHGSLQHIS